MSDDLDRLAAMIEAMTAGPWKPCPYDLYIFGGDEAAVADSLHDEDGAGCTLRGRGHGAEVSGRRREGEGEANVRGIAALRNVAPELLAVARAVGEGACSCVWGSDGTERRCGVCRAYAALETQLAEVFDG